MKLVYLQLVLVIACVTGNFAAAAALGDSAPDAATACASLLGMVQRNFLPHTTVGRRYPSGFRFGGSPEVSGYIASFFAFLRDPNESVQLTEELKRANQPWRLAILHHFSMAFAQTTLHLNEILRDPRVRYPGQEDGQIFVLLQLRQKFVREVVLPLALEAGGELYPTYFEELVAIASNFANVPTASGIAGQIIDAVEPHYAAYLAAGGSISPAELSKIKLVSLSLTYLEAPNSVDLHQLETALNRTSDLLRESSPDAHMDWLTAQLGYWFTVAFTVKNAPPFKRASYVTHRLIDVLPPDLTFAGSRYPIIVKHVGSLLSAEPWLPGLINAGRRDRLRQLILRH